MNIRAILTSTLIASLLASCDKDDDSIVKPYTVPSTYTFSNAKFSASANRNKMAEELRAYLNTAQTGKAITTLDATKINNMWSNTGNPFANASLNTAGFNIKDFSGNATLMKGFIDSISMYNTSTVATQGNGGYLDRGSNKIIVGPRGLEYVQGYAKGIMSTL